MSGSLLDGNQGNQESGQGPGVSENQSSDQNSGGGSQRLNGSAEGAGPNSLGELWDTLPDEVKGNESFAQFKDKGLTDVLKAYGDSAKSSADAEGKLKGALLPLQKNATPEQKAEFQTKLRELLGVPEKADGYKVQVEGIPADDPILTGFLGEAHKMGLNNEQVQTAASWFVKTQSDAWKAQQDAWLGDLSKHYGNRLDEAGQTAMKGLEGLAKDAGLDPSQVKQAVFGMGMNVHPVFFRILERAGAFYKEDGAQGNPGGGAAANDTQAFIKALYPSMAK